jgi:calcium-dependent protein kinase
VALLIQAILKALAYLESKEITHGNLKPESILIGPNEPFEKIQINDFEGGYPLDSKSSRENPPYCLAPEALTHKLEPKSDIWSVGVITFILLSGIPPLDDDRS